jgi:hypothetical protein
MNCPQCAIELRTGRASTGYTVIEVEVITTNAGGEKIGLLPVRLLLLR